PGGPPDAVTPAPALPGPPIFVVGVPRSGTTWLEHMLGAHRAVAGPGSETALFVSTRALWANSDRRPAVVAALRGFASEVFGAYLASHAPQARHLLEKTPIHAEHLEQIVALFPEAAVISIHRDGRDVVRSMLEMEAA